MGNQADRVLDFIRNKSHRPLKIKELSQALKITPRQYSSFRTTVKKLLNSGELIKLKRGRIGLPDHLNVIVGPLVVVRNGNGFVSQPGVDEDILIPSRDLFTGLDGDRVMVRLTGIAQGRQAGTIIKIVERATRLIVGLYRKGKQFSYVVPDSPRIHRDIYIHESEAGEARDGDKVVAELLLWDDPYLNPEGRVVERLGRPTDPGVDLLTVIKSFSLPEEFPSDVLKEAEKVAIPLESEDLSGRVDLTKECIYTIDPSDAKDHDDAVSIERKGSGYRLGIHIADVSHYVKDGSLLDKEAFARATSVYLPGKVIPMIPALLSNDICSLKANKKRLAHSVMIDFDNKGKMISWSASDTIIRSRASLSYEEVQEFFDNGKKIKKIEKVAESLLLARELAAKLTRRRFSEGSLDFDLPESKIVLNSKGEVLELVNRVRLESHRLVEEFMLAANRAVALTIFRAGEKFLYRVHERPDTEKMEHFSYMMSRLGHKFPATPNMKPIQCSKFLDKIKDSDESDFINELMLRSMKKATYQQENIGHFGLAFSHYGHFTSPIRRYPDLFVHRMLRNLKNKKYTVPFARRVEKIIDQVGKHCSEAERNAEAAERRAIKIKQVSYMAKKQGEEYMGVISGVIPHGFFVRLDNMGVEGMVRMSSIDDDYYSWDERHFRIVGRRTGRIFRLGDAIKVGVAKVDKTRYEIDLFIVEKKSSRAKRDGRPSRIFRRGGRK